MSNLVWKVATCNIKEMNNPVKQDDIMHWHKDMNNLVSIFTKTKLKGKIHLWIANKFSSLNSGYLGLDVAIVMNNFLTRHVCKVSEVPGHLISIKLLFRNRLSADVINSFIVKAANKSTFVILDSDFNEDGSHKCASFKKCFSLSLVNLLARSSVAKMPMWKNFKDVVKTIDYVFVSSNLVNAISCCNVLGVNEHFDTDYHAVSVFMSLGGLLNMQLNSFHKQTNRDHWKFDVKNANKVIWSEFKNATVVNTATGGYKKY
ncbi:hypothetical protein G9A89_019135 [Geosiphon pyriformis]|nr:hypothetical protein G9A89_019135 [Geosiphon pyriformis]